MSKNELRFLSCLAAVAIGLGNLNLLPCSAAPNLSSTISETNTASTAALKASGIAAFYQGRSTTSYRALNAYLTKVPNDPEALFYRSETNKNRAGRLSDLNKCIASDPDCARALLRRAQLKISGNHYLDALPDATMALNLYMKNAKTVEDFWYKAQAEDAALSLTEYKSTGKYCFQSNSSPALKRCIELSKAPDTYLEYLRGAIAAQYLDDYKTAVSIISQAIERYPQKIHLLTLRGNWLQNLGDYNGALADYEKTISLAPPTTAAPEIQEEAFSYFKDTVDSARRSKIEILYTQKKLKELGQECNSIQKISANDRILAQIYLAKGRLEAQEGDIKQALADYRSTSGHEGDPIFRLERARLLIRTHQFSQALDDLNFTCSSLSTRARGVIKSSGTLALFGSDPLYLSGLRNRAYARLQTGNILGAIADQTEVLKQEWENSTRGNLIGQWCSSFHYRPGFSASHKNSGRS